MFVTRGHRGVCTVTISDVIVGDCGAMSGTRITESTPPYASLYPSDWNVTTKQRYAIILLKSVHHPPSDVCTGFTHRRLTVTDQRGNVQGDVCDTAKCTCQLPEAVSTRTPRAPSNEHTRNVASIDTRTFLMTSHITIMTSVFSKLVEMTVILFRYGWEADSSTWLISM